MPSIEWNKKWEVYDWSEEGAEWSATWGGVETQWFATILPRIHNFIPTGTLLEIAPGYGRWTSYLISSCRAYIGVDFAKVCIDACKERFKHAKHARFFANDGSSLPMVAEQSVDFVFSFDSLVHVEFDILEAYLSELSRVMAPDSIGFLHHSNLGALWWSLKRARILERTSRPIPFARQALARLRMIDWDHARAPSMTAERFASACAQTGLVCVGQEIIEWGHRKMIDCVSVIARQGSRWQRSNVIVSNRDFMAEASSASRIARVYDSLRVGRTH